MADMEKFIPGRYVAKQDDDYNWMNRYQITIDLKETEKSIIIEKVEMIGRYLPAQIELLFQHEVSECHVQLAPFSLFFICSFQASS